MKTYIESLRYTTCNRILSVLRLTLTSIPSTKSDVKTMEPPSFSNPTSTTDSATSSDEDCSESDEV
jgi:hypothetical protein